MRVPASLHHRPVSFITVHRNRHTAAARRDTAMESVIIEFRKNIFKLIHILQSGSFRNVAAIQQDVCTHFTDAFLLRFADHRNQMRDIGMYVAVGEQTYEMQLSVMLFYIGNRFLPCVRIKNLSRRDRFIYQLRALRINLSAAESVMPDLGVSHITVRRQTDRCSGCLDRGMRPAGHQLVDLGLVCVQNRVAVIFVSPADAVHNYQYYRFAHIFPP